MLLTIDSDPLSSLDSPGAFFVQLFRLSVSLCVLIILLALYNRCVVGGDSGGEEGGREGGGKGGGGGGGRDSLLTVPMFAEGDRQSKGRGLLWRGKYVGGVTYLQVGVVTYLPLGNQRTWRQK